MLLSQDNHRLAILITVRHFLALQAPISTYICLAGYMEPATYMINNEPNVTNPVNEEPTIEALNAKKSRTSLWLDAIERFFNYFLLSFLGAGNICERCNTTKKFCIRCDDCRKMFCSDCDVEVHTWSRFHHRTKHQERQPSIPLNANEFLDSNGNTFLSGIPNSSSIRQIKTDIENIFLR